MAENAEIPAENLESQLQMANWQADYYRESYEQAVQSMLAMDNEGWDLLVSPSMVEGFTLEELKQVSEQLSEWADTNPLLLSAHQKRCAYMFGGGKQIGRKTQGGAIPPRFQKMIDDPDNQATIFSEDALAVNERARYTSGVVLVRYNTTTNKFSRLPLAQISNVVTDPDNDEVVWFYLREYERSRLNLSTSEVETEEISVWYPTDRCPKTKEYSRLTQIDGDPIDRGFIVIDDIVGRHTGATWGVPDAFAAAPWAHAYSKYLKDGTKVLAALAEFAWKLTPKGSAGAATAGATVRTGSGAGSTVVTDMEMQSMPSKNAVDLATGRPLAAQVAGPLGLSIEVLLSDAGEDMVGSTGGPSIRILEARRRVNEAFLKRCLVLMGIADPTVRFAKMSPDADYREQQTLVAALGTGLFWADEIREPLARVANVELTHPKEPDGFMVPNNTKSVQRADIDPATGLPVNTPPQLVPTAQGAQKGTVPPPPQSTVKPDGTTSLTAGQGKPVNTNKPSYGVNDLRGTGGTKP